MNYNYIINTGTDTLQGSRSSSKKMNVKANYTQYGFNFDNEYITGSHLSLASLNSQTLLEEDPTYVAGINRVYSSINTGDYFISDSGTRGDLPDGRYRNKFRLDGTVNFTYTDNFYYDQRDFSTGKAFLTESTSYPFTYAYGSSETSYYKLYNLQTGVAAVDSEVTDRDSFVEKYNIFVNGQKIQQTSSAEYISLEFPPTSTTGILFAIEKQSNTRETYSTTPDMYNWPFIGGEATCYINGMRGNPEDFLHTYTGVTGIRNGVNSYIALINEESHRHSL